MCCSSNLGTGLLKAEKDGGKGLKQLIAAAGGSVAVTLPTDFADRSGIALADEHQVLLLGGESWVLLTHLSLTAVVAS